MKNKRNSKNLLIIPIAFAIGIIPLILKVTIHTNEDKKFADIFFACKAYAIECLMIFMAVILLFCMLELKKKLPWGKELIPFVGYLIFVLLSGVLSEYGQLAFGGSYERFEPVWVILGYAVIMYYSFSFVKGEDGLRLLVRLSVIPVGIMLLLGILQGIGLDPFNLTVVKKLILPLSLQDKVDNLQLMREKGVAYLTLYNEDYVGMYFGLTIPICASMIFAAGKRTDRVIAVFFTLASLFVLYRSHTSAGWVVLALTGVIALMIFPWKSMRIRIIIRAGTGIAFILCVLIAVSVWPVRSRVSEKLSPSPGRAQKVIQLETGDYDVAFYFFDGNELHCSFDYEENDRLHVRFTDKDGNELIYHDNGGIYELEERFMYADATVSPWHMEDVKAVMFTIDDHQWPIYHEKNGGYYYIDNELNKVKAHKAITAGLFSDGLMSGRGAIWNRTLPLLLHHIFIGAGANTFVTEYPQDDYVLLNYLYGWGYKEINVKAHSLYLGNMIENGIIGTLCLMTFFLMFIIKGICIYGKSPDGKEGRSFSDFSYFLGFGIFMGCLAYMISGLINDSNVCTAPVFWAFVGVSMGMWSNGNSKKEIELNKC